VFIGPTQFAAGEWVGVELDAAVGKNDGSVNGVRYFTCKPLHGVFAKAAKLTKHAATDDAPESGVASAATSQSSINVTTENNIAGKQPVLSSSNADVPVEAEDSTLLESSSSDTPVFDAASASELPSTAAVSDPAAAGDSSEMPPPAQMKQRMIPRPTHGSTTSLHRGSTTDLASTSTADSGKPTVRVGDRVVVSGNKIGTVRYVGTTDFAKGDWVGVELDEPLGKNDGSVQGKR